MTLTVAIMACTPMRLATKLGVSLPITMPLPRRVRAKSATKSAISGSVSAVGISSNSFMYRGGLKKCVPRKRGRSSSGSTAAISVRERPLVLLLKIASGPMWGAAFCRTIFLIFMSSLTTSMTQSASFRRGRSSSRLPVSIRAMRS